MKKKKSKKTQSTIARIYKLVGSWRILSGAIFGAIGTIIIFSPSDLRLRIDIHRQIWIEGVGTAIVLMGIFWPYFWQLLVVFKDAFVGRG